MSWTDIKNNVPGKKQKKSISVTAAFQEKTFQVSTSTAVNKNCP